MSKILTDKEIKLMDRKRRYHEMIERNAIKLLGKYAYQKKHGFLLKRRVDNLVRFMKENHGKKIEVVINNNWSYVAGKPSKKEKLGGTTFKYMVWAVIK